MSTVSRAVRTVVFGMLFSLTLGAAGGFAAPPLLRWNGPAGGVWDTATPNWLDAGDNAVAWIPGAEASFESAAGGLVEIAADVSATNLTFTGNGYTLLGAGRLRVEGALTAAAATTNCIAADLRTVGGLTKSGAGALALARCAGPVSVQAGSLLAAGSLFADAEIAVAAGASLVTLGEPDSGANLIANGSFETPAMANGAYQYVSGGNVIDNWSVTAYPNMVARQNTVVGNPWNSAGASPDGVHMLILQYGGSVAQSVTVPADGLYCIAFSHLRRQNDDEHQVYVRLDGRPLAAFLNRAVQFAPGRFASGVVWLSAGTHTLGIGGEHSWDDRSSMIDAVCFAVPSGAQPCRALGGDSLLRAATGASVVLAHSGSVPLAYVALDGTPAAGTFDAAHTSGIFSGSGSLACAAPGNVYAWQGSGAWSDAARWQDGLIPAAGGGQNLLTRFPSAAGTASTNTLAGTFQARGLWAAGLGATDTATLAGNAVALTNSASGAAPRLMLASPGTWTLEATLLARTPLTVEADGNITVAGQPLTVPNGQPLAKCGPGTVTLPTLTNAPNVLLVYEGTVQTPQLPAAMTVNLLSQAGRSAALCLTQGDVSFNNRITLRGTGVPAFATRCGGGLLTATEWSQAHGDIALIDVGADDTLSLRQILSFYGSGGARISQTVVIKAGPGTLEIRSGGADAGENRAYRGGTVLRNGTLILAEDDWGTLSGWTNPFNGRTYAGTGGSLGYTLPTNAVLIGDSGTAPSDALALIAAGSGRWVGHDIEVADAGAGVTLGMTAGSAMFAGTLTLHRGIALSGPSDGTLSLNTVAFAGGFTGPGITAVTGLGALRIEGAWPSSDTLAVGACALSFGTRTVKGQTLQALTLGTPDEAGALDVDFAPGGNDTLTVTAAGGLTLSNTLVNLYYAGSGLPFAEPGTYTLFHYAGSLGGDAALLSVGNPQPGAAYLFADDAANGRVTLTITGAAGGTAAVWTHPESGAWATGANWNSGTAPNGAGLVPLFGLAITNDATVDTGTGYTVGGLLFNNSAYGYTLGGSGGLTVATNGAVPVVTVLAGTHALDTAVNAPDGLAVATSDGAALALDSDAAVIADVTLAAGTLEVRGDASVAGTVHLAAGSLLRASSTAGAAIGTLSGDAGAQIAWTGTAPTLHVNQASDATFSGTLNGASDATLSKLGTGTLSLVQPYSPFVGQASLDAGTLALQSVVTPATIQVPASGTLAINAPVTNGLMGYYYNVSPNTNAFWTLAGMESHFAALTPNLVLPSGASGDLFDFGVGTTYTFPAPYNSGGSRATYFEAVWRGVITLPENGTYTFGVQCDDGVMLAIDGRQILARNFYSGAWLEGSATLDADRHDLVLGYFQQSGGGGIRLRVRRPSQGTAQLVPSSWLTPYAQASRLSGSGALSLATPSSVWRTAQAGGIETWRGIFSGASGSLFAKAGAGCFSLAGSGAPNAFAGGLDVQAGILALDAHEQVGDASRLSVCPGATLALAATETVGALSGGGSLAIGGGAYLLPFSGDADCGLSTGSTYTHLLDFPLSTANPIVNGVLFNDLGSFTGSLPGGAWNSDPNDTTRSGIDSLLWDFSYGSTDFTFQLTGLTAGQAYDLRLYFRNFASNPRHLTFTFTAGARLIGSINHNPDSLARSIVGCRYVADASQSVTIRVVSHESAHSCHLYGLSNEALAGLNAARLTVAPAAGQSATFSGGVTGLGELVVAGAGTQRFGGANTLASPLAVEAGTAALESGASVSAGATVNAGATLALPTGGVTLGGLTGAGVLDLQGGGLYPTNTEPYFVTFTNDAGCGISPAKVYTHTLDFGGNGSPVFVNGVSFTRTNAISGVVNGYGWVNAPPSAHGGGNAGSIGLGSDNGIYNLLYGMNYNLASGQTMKLTGLTPGTWYEVRLYNRTWDPACNRTQTMTFDPDGAGPVSHAVTYDFDVADAPPNYLGYRYLAATNELLITITRTVNDSYHLYALTNEESGDGTPGAATLDLADDCVFDGTVTGNGGLIKSGAGAFTVTGVGDGTGALTVSGGACGVAEGGRITAGPVSVLAGATLFGHGQMGGPVSVASNAWLQAGTAAACGTLAVGGDLTLAPGARIAWRYAAGGACDTVTVAGAANVPSNGLVQVSSLTPGLPPPAKGLLLAAPAAINGPDDLSGWTVEGAENASLRYSDDRTKIYFFTPRGTLLVLE